MHVLPRSPEHERHTLLPARVEFPISIDASPIADAATVDL